MRTANLLHGPAPRGPRRRGGRGRRHGHRARLPGRDVRRATRRSLRRRRPRHRAGAARRRTGPPPPSRVRRTSGRASACRHRQRRASNGSWTASTARTYDEVTESDAHGPGAPAPPVRRARPPRGRRRVRVAGGRRPTPRECRRGTRPGQSPGDRPGPRCGRHARRPAGARRHRLDAHLASESSTACRSSVTASASISGRTAGCTRSSEPSGPSRRDPSPRSTSRPRATARRRRS